METGVKKLYEGMFLVDSAEAASDWDGIVAEVKRILKRSEAEIISVRKWDERPLAYDVNGTSRGSYILSYFKVEGPKVGSIERDVQLSEKIMRVLILCGEHFTEEDIEKETPAVAAEKKRDKKVAGTGSTEEPGKAGDNEEADKPDDELAVDSTVSDEVSEKDRDEAEKKRQESVQEEAVGEEVIED